MTAGRRGEAKREEKGRCGRKGDGEGWRAKEEKE